MINAKREILEKHADPNTGIIDYSMNGVTGENNLAHDHWVDSIGNDVIADFNKAEGDKITTTSHTTEVYKIEMADVDGDGDLDDTILHLRSNQGNADAHHLDLIGTLAVLNNALTANDFTVDAGPTYGIVSNISQINAAISPLNPSASAPTDPVDPGTDPGAGTDPVTQPTLSALQVLFEVPADATEQSGNASPTRKPCGLSLTKQVRGRQHTTG